MDDENKVNGDPNGENGGDEKPAEGGETPAGETPADETPAA